MTFKLSFDLGNLDQLPKSYFTSIMDGYIELDIDGIKITNRKGQEHSAYSDYLFPLMEKLLQSLPYIIENKEIQIDFVTIQGRFILKPDMENKTINIRATGRQGSDTDDRETHQFQGNGEFFSIPFIEFYEQIEKASKQLIDIVLEHNPEMVDDEWLLEFKKSINENKKLLKTHK